MLQILTRRYLPYNDLQLKKIKNLKDGGICKKVRFHRKFERRSDKKNLVGHYKENYIHNMQKKFA